MNEKEEVLSIRYQFQWRNSRINDESFHEVFRVQHISKVRTPSHSTKKKTRFQSSREEDPYLAWRKHDSSEGGLL